MSDIPFNWADWLIVAVIGLSSLISLVRGFVREALSLATWVAAFVIARLYTSALAVQLQPYVETPSVRLAIAFAILFLLTLIAGAIVNFLISQLVRATGLSGLDRLLGVGFGFARGLVLVIFIVAVAKMTPMPADPWWQQSTLLPHVEVLEQWSRATFGDVLQELAEQAPAPVEQGERGRGA